MPESTTELVAIDRSLESSGTDADALVARMTAAIGGLTDLSLVDLATLRQDASAVEAAAKQKLWPRSTCEGG